MNARALPSCLVLILLSGCSLIADSGDFEFEERDAAEDADRPDARDAGEDADAGEDDAGDAAVDADATDDASDASDAPPPECSASDPCPARDHASVACEDGACVITECELGFEDCDEQLASGCEVAIREDMNNCGACETVCVETNGAVACDEGTCTVTECAPNYADCDHDGRNGCEASLVDVGTCRDCDTACGSTQVCTSSGCADTCSATLCGTSCVNTQTSEAHCGRCDNLCSGPGTAWECSGGECEIDRCLGTNEDCNGDDSDGCETNLSSAIDHCGECFNACSFLHGVAQCLPGGCDLVSCVAPYDDCDAQDATGCERNLDTDVLHCGGCGNACELPHAAPVCSDGACEIETCEDGYDSCDTSQSNGCETSLETDEMNCGACDNACELDHASPLCGDGSCEIASCDGGFDDCDTLDANGCESELAVDPMNCGGCGTVCGAGEVCEFGVCDPVDQVTAGLWNSCFLHRSGRVYCVGANQAGQLGNGSTRRSAVPVLVMDGAGPLLARRIATGDNSTCAVMLDGKLKCWGRGQNGELGRGGWNGSTYTCPPTATVAYDSTTPQLVASADSAFAAREFVDVAAFQSGACGLDTTGDMWCWGRDDYGEIGTTVPGTSGRADVLCATHVDGVSDVDEMGLGQTFACARSGTQVRCWGSNSLGEIGIGNTMTPVLAPTLLTTPSGVTALRAGGSEGCVLAGGNAYCWGYNVSGAVGVGTSGAPVTTPTVLPALSGVTDIETGYAAFATTGVDAYSWGTNLNGTLARGTIDGAAHGTPERAATLDGGTRFAMGIHHACMIRRGRAYCWGKNADFQLGIADNATRAPTFVGGNLAPTTGITDISVGGNHTCFVRGGIVFCAGDITFGQLGLGITVPTGVATPMTTLPDGVSDIAAGSRHNCALSGTSTKVIDCWGSNDLRELGSAAFVVRGTLVRVPLAGASAVAAGGYYSCAIVSGTPYCWGQNNNNQLGRGAPSPSSEVPMPVIDSAMSPLVDVEELALGEFHGCARQTSGTVYCWGYGANGQLGAGVGTSSATAVVATELGSARAITVGRQYSCAIPAAPGRIRCVGQNNYAQMDVIGVDPAVTALRTDWTATDTVALGAGSHHTCGVRADGSVNCWGWGENGQLGIPYVLARQSTPVGGVVDATVALSTVESNASNTPYGNHTCGLASGGRAVCWGDNGSGRLASGDSFAIGSPTIVLVP